MHHLDIPSSADLSPFSKVKVVCLAGSAARAKDFATKLKLLYGDDTPLEPAGGTDRGALYLVGEVISMSHGMGIPSCLIFLNEVVKLLSLAMADLKTIDFIRLGTSGGIGTPGGHVVITEEAVDSMLEPGFLFTSCGKQTRFEAKGCEALNMELLKHGRDVHIGKTMAADDYYEAQARLDGAIPPWYTEVDKMEYLQRASKLGVLNIEMECTGFLSFFQRMNLRAAVVCVSLLDRLQGDQHYVPKDVISRWSSAPQDLALRFLIHRLNIVRLMDVASNFEAFPDVAATLLECR